MLTKIGYKLNNIVNNRGTYQIKGDTLIFSPPYLKSEYIKIYFE